MPNNMTLAVACLTKDGAVMLADKRESTPNGSYRDTVTKIYPLGDKRGLLGVMTAAGDVNTIAKLREMLTKRLADIVERLRRVGESEIAVHLSGYVRNTFIELGINERVDLLFLLAYIKDNKEIKQIILCSSSEPESDRFDIYCEEYKYYIAIGSARKLANDLFNILRESLKDPCASISDAIINLGFIFYTVHKSNTSISKSFDVLIYKNTSYYLLENFIDKNKEVLIKYEEIFQNIASTLNTLATKLNSQLFNYPNDITN
jgi:20S proteasome alpha/beta subunit